jgi:arsenite methyltransferase
MKLLKRILGVSRPPDPEQIRAAIRKKYAEVSRSAEGKFKYPTGREGARALGYDPALLAEMPGGMVESFCGVGNPFTLGPIHPGERVLDVGCGAGFDLFVAARMVGPEGGVSGVDLTEEMVEQAWANLEQRDVSHGEVRQGSAEDIPYADATFDVVISNGVLNLSPQKEKSFREIHRVLKPGGRLQFADMVLRGDLPRKVAGNLDAWSD